MPSLSTDARSFDCGMHIFQIIISNISPARFVVLIIINNRTFAAFRAAFWRLSHRTTLSAVLACIVFSVAGLSLISLTPRFSEVHGRVYHHNRFSGLLAYNKKPLKRLGTLRLDANTRQ